MGLELIPESEESLESTGPTRQVSTTKAQDLPSLNNLKLHLPSPLSPVTVSSIVNLAFKDFQCLYNKICFYCIFGSLDLSPFMIFTQISVFFHGYMSKKSQGLFSGGKGRLRQDFWEHDTFKKDLGIDGIVIQRMMFQTFIKTFPWKSNIKNIVKY